MVWIIAGIIYFALVVICWINENRKDRIRAEELEERRRIQNIEWEEQFNVLPENVRYAIEMAIAERRETLRIMALLRHYHYFESQREKNVDWKKEGF